jgi:FPC/CPF motif-containing protein YcgG
MLPTEIDNDDPLAERFRAFIKGPAFPCVGAKAALGRDQIQFVVARDMTSAWDDLRIYAGLHQFASEFGGDPTLFKSFVVLFKGPTDLSEEQFEQQLWLRAQSLSDKDAWHGQTYDERVSSDVDSPHFSLSFGGEGFFIVGLHPKASRPARRFAVPAMVFNLHDQFEQLRAAGRYEPLRAAILERDVALAGSVNPMLERHGEGSEARQYSGRAAPDDWRCPFQPPKLVSSDAS